MLIFIFTKLRLITNKLIIYWIIIILQAHEAIAEFQKRLKKDNRIVSIVTQNIDGLHQKAGAENVVELHGSLLKTQCTKCKTVEKNECIPICPALEGKG